MIDHAEDTRGHYNFERVAGGWRLTLNFPHAEGGPVRQSLETIISPIVTKACPPALSSEDVRIHIVLGMFLFLEHFQAFDVDEGLSEYSLRATCPEKQTGLIFQHHFRIELPRPVETGNVRRFYLSDMRESLTDVEPSLKSLRYRADPREVSTEALASALGENGERLLPAPESIEKHYLFAVDETGDPAANFKNGSSELFVTSCIAIPTEKEADVEQSLRQLLASLNMGYEIKSTSLDRLRDPMQTRAKDAIDAIIRKNASAIWAVAQWKVGSHRELNLQDIKAGYRGNQMAGLNKRLKALAADGGKTLLQVGSLVIFTNVLKFTAKESSDGEILFDRMNKAAKNKEIKDAFSTVMGWTRVAAENSHLSLKLVDSRDEPLVWLADYVSKEISKRISGMDSRWSAFKGLLPRHSFGAGGHFVAAVDVHGKYGFWNLESNELVSILPD